MTQFLFITHITPERKRSPLRRSLNEAFFRSLKGQTWKNWKSIIVGEEEKTEGPFHFIALPDVSGEARFSAIREMLKREDVKQLISESKYTVKLDDDDLIAPGLLERTADLEFDCYYDRFHTFYDISSGKCTQQERPWMASTCIHRTAYLFGPWTGEGSTAVGNLLYTDHSKAWHRFYENHKTIAAPREHPVYLRVLSPTSITSGALHGPPQQVSDIDFEKYYAYLKSFGNWKSVEVHDFDAYLSELSFAWKNFAGRGQQALPDFSSGENLIRRALRKLRGN